MPDYRQRLYEAYSSTHSGRQNEAVEREMYRRNLAPLLPASGRVLEIGCGQGATVRLMQEHGLQAEGIDISAEQVAIARAAGLAGVHEADIVPYLSEHPGAYDAIVAIDVLEHFEPEQLLEVMDAVRAALRPGGRFVARSPNAVSPFSGNYRYGDLTHGLSFTPRSVQQLCNVAGFGECRVYPVHPVATRAAGRLRLAAWKGVSAAMAAAFFVETGIRETVMTQNLTFVART